MKTDEIREKYLTFFQSKGHARRPSDVLVPTWDPSVLFTPAGMNQFKDHFLGKVKLDFTRATTCQKCLRTGDIDNVGRTAYHHTFFEMLGNFSFGDYFKRDAIHWAWEFLTDKKWLGLPAERLTVSVYLDDDEAASIWRDEIKLEEKRIVRMGEADNFWPASAPSEGPDGVCGPCSEIFYHPEGGGKEVEIWNLVFTQFNRVGEPPDNLKPLPSKNIDTGMGLERTAAVMQGVESNFHIDILKPIVAAAGEVVGVAYDPKSDNGRRLRRITDHVRACTFAIHENVYPGPNKEKYVIKRLLRRAVLDGHQMGLRAPFLHQLVPAVVESMKGPYPELAETQQRVAQAIQHEEANFFSTIDGGLARIDRIFQTMDKSGKTVVDGEEAADLYQTYGVPPELFEALSAEREMTFDWAGFRRAMDEHADRNRVKVTVMGDTGPVDTIKKAVKSTPFVGYDKMTTEAVIKGIVVGDEIHDSVVASDADVIVVLDHTPFYAESGGQIGDTGTLTSSHGTFEVYDTQKNGEVFLHYGKVTGGKLATGDTVKATVAQARRDAIRRAHSATHILHYALHQNLGSHAQQQGSKVDDDLLRFDFTNQQAITPEQLAAIEQTANEKIKTAAPINAKTVPLAEARQAGAMMLFGEKYPDPVRMISMGDFSRELCGGTHLSNTQEVGVLDIVAEEGVSAGTRRIVALTGVKAEENAKRTQETLDKVAKQLSVAALDVPEAVQALTNYVRQLKKQLAGGGDATLEKTPASKAPPTVDHLLRKTTLRRAARLLNVPVFEVPDRVTALLQEVESVKQEIANLAQAGDLSADGLLARGEAVGAFTVIVAEVPGANSQLMRQLIDQVRRKSDSSATLLISAAGDDKVTLVAGVTDNVIKQGLRAGDWAKEVAAVVGGSGGGKPDMAQAGGKEPGKIPDAIALAQAFAGKRLAARD